MPTQTPNDHFEDRLLVELRQVVADRPKSKPTGLPVGARRPNKRRYTRGALAGGGLAAMIAATLIVAGSGSAAYAVESHSDGTVTVEVNSLKDAAGLQSQLRAAGVPALVNYLPVGKSCKAGRFTPATPARALIIQTTAPDGSFGLQLDKSDLKPGDTVLFTGYLGRDISATSVAVAQGEVKPCEIVDAPQIPEPGYFESSR